MIIEYWVLDIMVDYFLIISDFLKIKKREILVRDFPPTIKPL